MAKPLITKILSFETLKGADIVLDIKLYLPEAEGWLYFDQYNDPSDIGQPKTLPPVVKFSQWRDDNVFANIPIVIDPDDPRRCTFKLTAAAMETANVRTSRVFFRCVGMRKTDGVVDVLFTGTVDIIR